MLDFNYTEKEDAIEEVFYNFLKGCTPEPLTPPNGETLAYLTLIPKDVKFLIDEKPFVFQVIEKRVEHCFTFRFTDERAIMALCLFCESAGKAVMALWYLQGWCFKNNRKEIDLTTLCVEIFPIGFFSEEDLHTAWDKQKVDSKNMMSDNLLDYNKAGSSIQFKD